MVSRESLMYRPTNTCRYSSVLSASLVMRSLARGLLIQLPMSRLPPLSPFQSPCVRLPLQAGLGKLSATNSEV